ncbi:hypothetical protein AMTR_s05276p00003370, partial [Amborella trichopoda]
MKENIRGILDNTTSVDSPWFRRLPKQAQTFVARGIRSSRSDPMLRFGSVIALALASSPGSPCLQ